MLNIYTDGACQGNPGEAGWGFYIPEKEITAQGYLGYLGQSTNNIAELIAVEKAINWGLINRYIHLTIITDSNYVINILEKRWKAKKNKSVIKNILNKIQLLETVRGSITFKKVKGHAGIKGNEIADDLATEAIALKELDLIITKEKNEI